jgi:hypothetical protein
MESRAGGDPSVQAELINSSGVRGRGGGVRDLWQRSERCGRQISADALQLR